MRQRKDGDHMRLIDADALRQVLEVFTEKDTLGHTPLQLCDAMPTVSQWHRVEEELPDKNGRYLVFDRDDGVMSAVYIKQRKESEWTDESEEWCDFPVTYWMPLPEPPEEE